MKRINAFLLRNQQFLMFLFVLFTFVLLSVDIYARMGGGGGSNSSSGGGDGGLVEIAFYLFLLLPPPYNYIAIAALVIGGFIFSKLKKQGSVLNRVNGSQIPVKKELKSLIAYKQMQPNFSEQEFIQKVSDRKSVV